MQTVKFLKDMPVSPDGANTVKVKKGDVLPVSDSLAESLAADQSAEPHEAKKPKVEKSAGGAPQNK